MSTAVATLLGLFALYWLLVWSVGKEDTEALVGALLTLAFTLGLLAAVIVGIGYLVGIGWNLAAA